ncbi:FeoA family protein [Desulforhopalus sp. IMCC35007]|uniref:FeoA family protein n=1 Tax=Desulforhopalus sp. IMCC35007 TaxID=2569543 RepID=UPI0010AE6BF1|nr:FeoA family protein [Desulforhopalus sp. IMCC35007]TKB05810.1 ferrous iron transport protein A [Desulforhopalus sp. IMCC35007]
MPQCSFPLACATEGERVKIVGIRGGANLTERLLSMGIHVEDQIEVVQRQDRGAVLIARDGSRYALGGGMAHKINVIRCE